MTDKKKSDANPFDPPQWLVNDMPAPTGLPPWLEGLELPDEPPPEANAAYPHSVPLTASHPELSLDYGSRPRPASWPEIVSLSPSPNGTPAQSDCKPTLPPPAADRIEPDWDDLPKPAAC